MELHLPKRNIITGLNPVTESKGEYYDKDGNLHIAAGVKFRRARLAFHQIARALQLPKEKRVAALMAIPVYKSRGKGRSKPFIASCVNRKADRSKYFPHQGVKETARRAG